MADTFNMSDVMISYSRKDKGFVQKLNVALTKVGRETWVDWDDIAPTVDWWEEIKAGIEAAHTFVFVITPNSVQSEICRQEIDHAVLHNKRVIPILHKELVADADKALMHPILSSHNWIMMRAEDDSRTGFKTLLRALETDLSHVRLHTRLLVRANEWNARDKSNSLLLRGDDLREAENWLQHSQDKNPAPTALQVEYIQQSRQMANTILQRLVATAVLTFILLAVALVFSLIQADNARASLSEARERGTQVANQAGTAESALVLAGSRGTLASDNNETAIANAQTALHNAELASTNESEALTQASIADANQEEAETQAADAQAQSTLAQENADRAETEAANAIAEATRASQNEDEAQTQAAIAQTNESNALIAEQTAELEAQNAQTQAAIANENATQSALNAQAEQTQAQVAAQNGQTAVAAAGTANYNATQSALNAQTAVAAALTSAYNEGEAQTQAYIATVAQGQAELEALRNQSLALAQQALISLDSDRPLAMHLALLAVKIAQDNGFEVPVEAEASLNQVGNSMGRRYQMNLGATIYDVIYHPTDNHQFISSVSDRYIRLWRWDMRSHSYEVAQTLHVPEVDGAVTEVIYNSSGTHIAFSTNMGRIGIRDATTLQPIAGVPDIIIAGGGVTTLQLITDYDGIFPDRILFGTGLGEVGIRDFMTLGTVAITDISTTGSVTSLDYNVRWDRIYFTTDTGIIGTRRGSNLSSLNNAPDHNFGEPIVSIVRDSLRHWVIVATQSGQIRIIWFNNELDSVREVNRSVGINDLAIYGDTLVVATDAPSVDLYNVHTFRLIKSFSGHIWDVTSVAISPDGERAISASAEGQIFIWDIQEGNFTHEFHETRNPIDAVRFLPTGVNNQYDLIAGGRNLYNWTFTPSGDSINATSFTLPQPPHVHNITHDPQTDEWLYSTNNGQIRLESGTTLFTSRQSALFGLAINPVNPNYMVTGGINQHGVYLWQRINGVWTEICETDTIPNSRSVVFSPDGNYLIVSALSELRIYQIDYATPTLTHIDTFTEHIRTINQIAINPLDPAEFATASEDGTVRIWDMSDITHPTVTHVLSGHTSPVMEIAYHPDGIRLASVSLDGTMRWWNADTGHVLHTMAGYLGNFTSVDFSPDGHYITVGLDVSRSTVQLWQYRTLNELYAWVCNNQPIRDLTAQERTLYNIENFAHPCTNYVPQPRYVDGNVPAPIMIPTPVVTPTPTFALINEPVRPTVAFTPPAVLVTVTPLPDATLTASPSPSLIASPSPVVEITAGITAEITVEVTPDVTVPSASPSPTLTPTSTPSSTLSPLPTLTPSPTPTPTLSPTITPSPSPTATVTPRG